MNSSLVGLTILTCTFGSSMLAIQVRRLLPSHHMASDSKDVLKLVVALTSTLTALVLGLLISSAYSSYQLQRVEIQDLGTRFFEVDRILAQFEPASAPQRQQLQQLLKTVQVRLWPKEGVAEPPQGTVQAQGEAIFRAIADMPARDNAERLAQTRAAQLLEDASNTWHHLLVQKGGSLSVPLLYVLATWLVVLFFGFGMLTDFNKTVAAALFVGAAAVSLAVFLIVDLNYPYAGWIELPKSFLTAALGQMGH